MNNKKYTSLEVAKRLYNLDYFGFKEVGESVESIAKKIEEDPNHIILFLVDQVDELTSET